MSMSAYAAQNAVMTTQAGMLGSATTGVSMGSMGISNATTGVSSIFGQPLWNEGMHQFNCLKVENGWTLNYRNKQYIAADLDSLMDQMKAAMVTERIST